MNELKSKVTKWGIKLLTLGILAVVMCSVVNGQVEIERLKQAAQERREEARQEAKQNNLPTPAIVDADLIRPTLYISKFVGTSENVGIKDKNLPNTKNLDVEIDTDDVPKTEVDEITGKKVKDKEKKN